MPMPVAGRLGRASRFLVEYDYRDGLDANGLPIFRSGQIPSFARGGTINAAMLMDRRGYFAAAAPTAPRLTHKYNSTTGLYEPAGIALEPAIQNAALGSSDFSITTYFNNFGTATLTSARSCLLGQLATKHTGDGVTANSNRGQNVGTFVNGQTDVAYAIVEQGTAATHIVGIHDNTVPAVAAYATLTWATMAVSTSGTPAGSGVITLNATGPNGGKLALLWVAFTGTAAGTGANGNIRRLAIYTNGQPASSTHTYLHHGQLEPGSTEPHLPIITGAGAVTCSADTFTVPFNVSAAQLAATGVAIYEDYILTSKDSTTGGLLLGSNTVGGSGSAGTGCISSYLSPPAFRALVRVAGADASVAQTTPTLAIEDRIQRLTTISPGGVVGLTVAVNGGGGNIGVTSGVPSWPTAFDSATVYMEIQGTAARRGGLNRKRVVIAKGTSWTMDQLAG